MRLIAILLVMLLVGCATPIRDYKPLAIDISEPLINQVVVKSVGEEMLKQGKFSNIKALKVTATTSVRGFTVHPGLFRFTGSKDGVNHYQIGGFGEQSGSVEKSFLADPYQSVMVKTENNQLCVITIFNGVGCGDANPGTFVETQIPMLFENSIQQTLIYSGKIGNQIRIGYREFSNNFARPAFSNDVNYDLNESKIISYKGAALEIFEATNTYIRYKVLKNFNEARPLFPNTPSEPQKDPKGVGV
ncbi:MAG: hypothetical protein RLZZ596_1577 [Pseudomonadota bacterium]|jgi:hypothetical protein